MLAQADLAQLVTNPKLILTAILGILLALLYLIVGRFYAAFKAGRGLVGAWRAVTFGDNVPPSPPPPPQPQQQPAPQGNDNMSKIASIILIGALAACFAGCTFKREQTTINTPAVYAVTKDANGVLQSNLVSAASVKTTVEKERIWLPKGYAVTHNTVMYGIDVSMTDATTQTPKVRAGIVDDSWRWIPSDTNKLYAPPVTVSAELNNKAIPFSLSGKGRFTSGETQVSASDTNATASAIVPGTPADQK